jgi:hypothetical protein
MKVQNLISAMIGLWFVCSPWIFGFVDGTSEFYMCVVFGSVQSAASLLAMAAWRRGRLLNVLCALIGLSFIIFSNAFHVSILELVVFEVLGLASIMINYSVIFPESQ